MSDWFDRIAKLAALGERMTTLTDGVKSLAKKVEDHQSRLVRLETIIEITRPDGGVLRISPSSDK
jgi:C4-dicarboxylate-specific signal transduction histidine kinase